MILKRSLIKNLKFKKINKLEDYLFKCELLKRVYWPTSHKMYQHTTEYLDPLDQVKELKNLFFLWKINKKYNKLNFFF